MNERSSQIKNERKTIESKEKMEKEKGWMHERNKNKRNEGKRFSRENKKKLKP